MEVEMKHLRKIMAKLRLNGIRNNIRQLLNQEAIGSKKKQEKLSEINLTYEEELKRKILR